jgi:ubiquinone/menaquinone biosynthesis C-methylase UbiE
VVPLGRRATAAWAVFEVANVAALLFDDAFDLVVSTFSLHHWADPASA